MKPIATVLVGYIKIKIYQSSEDVARVAETENDGATRGVFDPVANTIHINNDLKGQELCEVLWHEIIHVFYRAYGWGARMNEEDLIRHLTPALVMFIRDNPDFVKDYLT